MAAICLSVGGKVSGGFSSEAGEASAVGAEAVSPECVVMGPRLPAQQSLVRQEQGEVCQS